VSCIYSEGNAVSSTPDHDKSSFFYKLAEVWLYPQVIACLCYVHLLIPEQRWFVYWESNLAITNLTTGGAMGKSTKVSFSKEHQSKSNPNKHVDVYRNQSDSSKTEKIGHSESSDGYNSTSVSIPVKRPYSGG
jgi:hypothetical protein